MVGHALSTTREAARLWHAALGHLRFEVSASNYNTWLRDTRAVSFADGRLVVEAGTPMACQLLSDQLGLVVRRALAAAGEGEAEVEFVASAAHERDEPAGASLPARSRPAALGMFNRQFTFERYVPTEGNRMALRQCQGLAGGDTRAASPIVIFGQPGMGKTHLLHALAGRVASRGARVACLSAEQFANEYLRAITKRQAESFQERIRTVDLLVVDDLQYLATGTKKGTLDELTHTIDAVSNAGGSVAIGSERNPAELDLPPRLRSRLLAGIVTRIAPFTFVERLAFCRYLDGEHELGIPGWALERVAGIEVTSVRELRGALNHAAALAAEGPLDLARLDRELVRTALATGATAACAETGLLETVARHYETTLADLTGRSRLAPLPEARAVAAATLRARGRPFSAIGEVLGGRDKSTIKDLVERGERMLATDADLRRRVAG